MFIKLGTRIFKSVKNAYPLTLSGKTKMPSNIKFSLENPYILEALPEKAIGDLKILEGKKLKTVCSILDNDNPSNIINRYKKLLSINTKGFNETELQLLYKKAFPNTKVPTDANYDAFIFLNNLSPEIGAKFDAHGLAKVSVTDQLKQLNKLLSKGIDNNKPFYTAPLATRNDVGSGLGTAGGHAYRDGSFIIVSDKSKKLCEDGIKHVIVNDAYYKIINDLQKKFPNINFVRADEAVEYFSKL